MIALFGVFQEVDRGWSSQILSRTEIYMLESYLMMLYLTNLQKLFAAHTPKGVHVVYF